MLSQITFDDARGRVESARRLLSSLPPEKLRGAALLDVGFGTGNMLLAALPFEVAEAVGVDVELEEFGYPYLDELAKEMELEHPETISRIQADFCQDDLGRTFDVITCLDVLEHVADPAATVRNIYRHLNPGGLAILDISPLYYSRQGHHVFWLFPWETMPWVHLYPEWPRLLEAAKVNAWIQQRVGELNRLTTSQLRCHVLEAGFHVLAEYVNRTGEDQFDEFRQRMDLTQVPTKDDLFLEWVRLDLERPH